MGTVAAIGAPRRVDGWSLAGVRVVPAKGAAAVREAWSALANDVTVLILTPSAADALADLAEPGGRLRVVLPP